ncbi:MAG: hypothetical protein PHX51_03905 [Clostridia bacterium]|nr:hypothetical protein [Clostridia bacterium]
MDKKPNLENNLNELRSLADSIENESDIAKSLELYEKAISLAQNTVAFLKTYKGRLEELNAKADKLRDE